MNQQHTSIKKDIEKRNTVDYMPCHKNSLENKWVKCISLESLRQRAYTIFRGDKGYES